MTVDTMALRPCSYITNNAALSKIEADSFTGISVDSM